MRTKSHNLWNHACLRAPHDLEELYGKDDPTEADLIAGDGDHVGTDAQAIDRLAVLFNWVAAQWPSLDRPSTPVTGMTYDQRQTYEWFDSQALGAKRDYGVFVPPGYDDPANADVRYPVLYLLHGYFGDPAQILPSTLLADAYMKDTDVKLRPMIVVAPSGACCFVQASTGARDCREADDNGVSLEGRSGWARECIGGNFFVSQVSGSKYEDSLLELLDVIDQRYRTLPAAAPSAR
jgi:hypothetical protein